MFDIDLSDYEHVLSAGKAGAVCRRAWPLMAAVVKVLDTGLREDFGF